MNANTESKKLDMDDLLDGTLDDLDDMPEIKLYPDGAHVVTLSFEETEINDKPVMKVTAKGIKTEELVNKGDMPINEGDETSSLYFLDTEMGQGSFKELMKPLAAHFGVAKLRALIEASQNAEVILVTKQNFVKKSGKTYQRFVEVAVV
jgi:hypothetical protein